MVKNFSFETANFWIQNTWTFIKKQNRNQKSLYAFCDLKCFVWFPKKNVFNFIFVFMKDGFVSFVNFIILFIYIYELLCLLLYFIDCHVCQHQILISVSFSRGYLSDQWYDTQLFHILVESSSCKKLCDSFFFLFSIFFQMSIFVMFMFTRRNATCAQWSSQEFVELLGHRTVDPCILNGSYLCSTQVVHLTHITMKSGDSSLTKMTW